MAATETVCLLSMTKFVKGALIEIRLKIKACFEPLGFAGEKKF